MAHYATLARDCGARIIGGCCGTMPEHLRAMRKALEATSPGPRPDLETISESLGGFSSALDGSENASSLSVSAGGGAADPETGPGPMLCRC